MRMISYAQNFEDVILWRALGSIPRGFYVDVGAFHPEIDSVTNWFYEQGWSGVNVEPVPEMFEILAAARPRDRNILAAAGAAAGKATMTTFPRSLGLSTLDSGRAAVAAGSFDPVVTDVEILPLRDLLAPLEGRDIHFLKIDVEGAERQVLEGMDFQRCRPWIVVVEATVPRSRERNSAEWEGLVLGAGYSSAYFDGLNCFFLAEERRELACHFGTPPNVFDAFELAGIVREREARRAAEASLGEVEAALSEQAAAREELGGQVAHLRTELDALRVAQEGDLERLRQAEAVRASVESEMATLGATLRTAQAELATLAEASRTARRHEMALHAELQLLHAAYHRLLSSRSWRWSAPLRKVRSLF